MKICFTASSGGHYEQLMKLQPLMHKYECFIVTERTKYMQKDSCQKTYYLKQINRKEMLLLPKLFINSLLSLLVFIKEKPDVVISTGVLSTIPISMLAKLFGKKLVFIESFAKISSPTKTGKILYRFADEFYVQWEEMLGVYPNAIFKGGIY